MAKKPTPAKTDVLELDAPSPKQPEAASSPNAPIGSSKVGRTARRLSDGEKARILELNADGKSKPEIASIISTSVPTVTRVLADGGVPLGKRAYTKSFAPRASAPATSDTHNRLINFAVSTLLGEPIDPGEQASLKELIETRLAEARKQAMQIVLAGI